jgi:hypothetical protein
MNSAKSSLLSSGCSNAGSIGGRGRGGGGGGSADTRPLQPSMEYVVAVRHMRLRCLARTWRWRWHPDNPQEQGVIVAPFNMEAWVVS